MPIIGNGDMASVLKGKKGITYFASGVSNSSETRESEFRRELDLLLEQDKNQRIVYFSSLCVFYSETPYALHKRMMEEVVKSNFRKYTIMRLGNITWGSNPHTIINFLKNKIKNKEEFKIQDTYRYLVDKDEFLYWIDMIPDWNCEMNITGRRMTIKQIVDGIR
jgi:nucleoside-diphosphate-sugar epimerase